MKRMLSAAAALGALLGVPTMAAAQDSGAPPPPMGGKMMRGGMGKMLEQRFAEMDANHDGAVTRAEYDAYRAKMRVEREARMKDHRDGARSRQGFDSPPPPAPPPPGAGTGAPLGYDPTGGAPPPPPGGDMGPPPAGGPHGPMGRPGGMGGDWFDRADADHDGKVTLAEAKVAARAMMAERRDMRGREGPGGDMPPPPPQ